MARKSSIDDLPEEVRAEVLAAIKRNATIDEIVWTLKGLGADVSRSAVGRFSKQYRDMATRQRDLASVATAFAGEFGEADDMQGRLLIQLVTSIATRMVMPMAAGEIVDEEIDFKELHYLARSLKDITSAAKTDVDREAKIRAEEGNRARAKAAKDAEGAARDAGASEQTINVIKARILGLATPQPAAAPKGGMQ